MMNPSQKVLPILLHGFFMISVNLFSIMTAVLSLHFAHWEPDQMMQAALALGINMLVYFGIFKLMSSIEPRILRLDDFVMLMTVLVVSLALLPVVYYPIYYLVHSAWSPLSNLLKTWPFQVVTNGVCLMLNYFVLTKRTA